MADVKFEVSPVGWTLLQIAWKSGRPTLAHNTVLRLSLDMMQTLVFACQHDRTVLSKLTGESELPPTFLSFAAALSNVIDLKLQQRVPNKESRAQWASATDFDHSVYLGVGQVLGNVIWPPSPKRNLREPGLEQIISSVAQSTVRDLQVDLLQQYLANVLQHLWDGARIRIDVPDLPVDMELRMRTDDCRAVAELAYERALELRGSPGSPSPETIQAGLASAIESILKNETV